MIKKILIICFMVISLFATTPKDTIVIGVENETSRINPLFDEDHDSALDFVFSGLTRFNADRSITGDLAKSWKVSKDKLTWIFHLRDDAYWHDGVKFTADDVKFTIEEALNDNLNAPAKSNFDEIKSVDVIDPLTVKITLKAPFPPLLDALSLGMLPKHLLEGKDINNDEFNQNPIGTGPYKFVKWDKGQYIRFEANDNFYRGKPKTKYMIIKFVPDYNVRAYLVKSGELDVAIIEPSLAHEFQKDKNIHVVKMNSSDYRALMFNFDNKILNDIAVRRAINYTIDRQSIAKKILHGYGSVATNPIQKSWANDDKVPTFTYNVKKAKDILAKDGWVLKDGVLQKGSQKLEFDIYAFNSDPLRIALANIIQSELAKIGIKAHAIAKNHGSFNITKVDSFIIGWGTPMDPDMQTYRIFTSSMDANLNENGWNYNHYSDKLVDEDLLKARTTDDIKERKAWYSKFLNKLHKNPPFAFLVYIEYPVAYNKNISGIKATTLGHHGAGFTYNVNEWSKK